MSKMSNEHVRDGELRDRFEDNSAAWLGHEVVRLEGVIAQAALLLDEGDPIKVLGEVGEALHRHRLDDDRSKLREMIATIARVRALLVGACP